MGTISGTVLDGKGTARAGVTVTRSGNAMPTTTTTTDAQGRFSFRNSPDGTYTLSAAKAGLTMVPASSISEPIRPTSVCIPVAVTIICPRPSTTVVPR